MKNIYALIVLIFFKSYTSAQTWGPVGSGFGGNIYALTVDSARNVLYAGGLFLTAGSVADTSIAQWNGSTWSPLSSGLSGTVQALIMYKGNLIAGGSFIKSGKKIVNNIASWDGAAWSALGAGIGGTVNCMAILNNELYVGGNFYSVDGNSVSTSLAKWNGVSWSVINCNFGAINALAVFNGELHAAGDFFAVNVVQKWDGLTWTAIGKSIGDEAYSLGVYDGELYTGGNLWWADDYDVNRIAKWNGSVWSQPGGGLGVLAGSQFVSAFQKYHNNLIVGGRFGNVDGFNIPTFSIAQWNGSKWNHVASQGTGFSDNVYALAVYNDTLYAAGAFNYVYGSVSVNHIARYYSPAPPLCPSLLASFNTSINTPLLGDTVNFTNTSSGATSYMWAVNGTFFSSAANASYTFNSMGNYTISLTATNGTCSVIKTQVIQVLCSIKADFTSVSDSVFLGDTLSLTNTSTGIINAYKWNIGSTVYTTKNISHVFSSYADSIVTLIVSHSDNCADTIYRIIHVTNCDQWKAIPDIDIYGRTKGVGFSIGGKGYISTGFNGCYYWGGKICNYFKDMWEYDPNTLSWIQKADFPGKSRAGAIGFSIGNKGYVGTGEYQYYNSAGSLLKVYTNDFWEFDPGANSWTKKADFPLLERSNATGFSIGNKGYIVTGNDSNGPFNDLWEYDPSNDTWTQKANFPGVPRKDAVGFSIGNYGYVGTGMDMYNSPLGDFWRYDPSTDSWTKKADFGGGTRYRAAAFAIGQNGYIATGSGQPSTWEYETATNQWHARLALPSRSQAEAFSIGGKGYLGKGDDVGFYEYTPCSYISLPNGILELDKYNNFITVYPNPSDNLLYIQSDEKINSLTCYNYLGQAIDLKLENNFLNIAALSKGMYVLNISTQSGKVMTKKFIKE